MSRPFEDQYERELSALQDLFGSKLVNRVLPRVREIHEYTEARWREYAEHLRRVTVRYLLIAEAPPWSPEGRPEYVLDPESRPRTLMRALRRAFLDCEAGSYGDSLETLAAHGFLLVDSVPFAMTYSSRSRSGDEYKALVRLTASSYLQQKIVSSEFDWAPDLRIAFSLKLNALAVTEALGELLVGGRRYPLSPQMIAVNGARYPDAGKLRQIFGLA